MKQGTCRKTGKLIGGVEYLRQRLIDALETVQGSLVIDRLYGARMHELIDMNLDHQFEMACYVRVAECIANPHNGLDDFRLTEMRVTDRHEGAITLTLVGVLLSNGEPIKLEGVLINARGD